MSFKLVSSFMAFLDAEGKVMPPSPYIFDRQGNLDFNLIIPLNKNLRWSEAQMHSAHWGTPSNALDTKVEKNVVMFATEHSAPKEIFGFLSFPHPPKDRHTFLLAAFIGEGEEIGRAIVFKNRRSIFSMRVELEPLMVPDDLVDIMLPAFAVYLERSKPDPLFEDHEPSA